jgi:hypothetical protein
LIIVTGDDNSEKIEMVFILGFASVTAERKLACLWTRRLADNQWQAATASDSSTD